MSLLSVAEFLYWIVKSLKQGALGKKKRGHPRGRRDVKEKGILPEV